MITAMCLGTLATICYALGRGPAVMLLGRVFWGAAWSGIWIGGNAIALYDFSSGEGLLEEIVPVMSTPSKLRFGTSAAYASTGYSGVVKLPL